MKTRQISTAGAILAAAILLAGCAGMSAGGTSGRIRLATDPAGATAYAGNVELGTTPLEIAPPEHFRSGFVGLSYRYYGKLSFRKPGCETYSVEVNDNLLAGDLHAKLKCAQDYRAPAAAHEKYADRLARIEGLRKQGLISAEEYQALRKRILDEL